MTSSRTDSSDSHRYSDDTFRTGRENLPTEAQAPGATSYLAAAWGSDSGWGFIINPPARAA